jgi:hypothetical protein
MRRAVAGMKALRLLLLLGAAALQAGCGLPDSYFLQAPAAVTQSGQSSINFQFNNPIHALTGTLDLNVNFIGNELYYRIYADYTTINQNVYDSTSASDPSTQLQNAGFLPMRSGSDQTNSPSIPLINIQGLAATGSTVTVVVSQSAASMASYYAVASGPTGEIRRDVMDLYNNVNHFKVFATNANTPSYSQYNYLASDSDMVFDTTIAPEITTVGSNTVYVAVYAVSYGTSISSTPVRSAPTYLGFMTLPQF